MERERLAQLIREHGLAYMGGVIGDPAAAFADGLREGWDVMGWRIKQVPGATAFWRVADVAPVTIAFADTDNERLTRRSAELAEINARRRIINWMTDPDQWDAETGRVGEIDREIATLAHTDIRERADQIVLCINALESERATWEAAIADSPVPTTLLMTPMTVPF